MKAKGQQFTIRFICSIRNIVLNSRKDFCSQNVCTQVNWLVFIAHSVFWQIGLDPRKTAY